MSQKPEGTDFFSLCTQFSKPFSQIETTILHDVLKTLRLFSNKRWKLSENLSVLTKHDKKCYKSEMSTFALER